MKKKNVASCMLFWSAMACATWAPAQGRRAVDDLGVEVVLDRSPQRIVSLAPNNTEFLFALGLGGRIVGVTNACDYPPEVDAIDEVAGYNTLNIEKIVAVEPDLVVAIRGNDLEGIKALEELGINVFSLEIQTVEQMLLAILRLGALTGTEEAAEDLRNKLQHRIRQVRRRVLAQDERPRIMWGGWSETVYTAGKGTMIDDVFRLAGGLNAGRAASGAWPQVGLETIIGWSPEVIITTYLPKAEGQTPEEVIGREVKRLQVTDGWRALPAVQKERIYFVDGDWLLRPGPRLVDALERIARLLHPTAFDD